MGQTFKFINGKRQTFSFWNLFIFSNILQSLTIFFHLNLFFSLHTTQSVPNPQPLKKSTCYPLFATKQPSTKIAISKAEIALTRNSTQVTLVWFDIDFRVGLSKHSKGMSGFCALACTRVTNDFGLVWRIRVMYSYAECIYLSANLRSSTIFAVHRSSREYNMSWQEEWVGEKAMYTELSARRRGRRGDDGDRAVQSRDSLAGLS